MKNHVVLTTLVVIMIDYRLIGAMLDLIRRIEC